MVHIEKKVTINRPVDEVFGYMSNAENDARWRTNVKYIKRKPGSDSGVGAEYEQKVKGPFGGLQADLRYTEYEKNKRVAFETTTGSVRPLGQIDFSAPSEDTTDVHFQLDWEPTGAWKVFAPVMGKILEKNAYASYDNLKQKMDAHEEETGPSGGD